MLTDFLKQVDDIGKQKPDIEGYIEFTDAPQKMMVRGLYPSKTCQRATEPTGSNESGELVNPIIYGQMLLGNFVSTEGGWSKGHSPLND